MLTLRILIADDQQDAAQDYARLALRRAHRSPQGPERVQTEVAIALTVEEALRRLGRAAATGVPFDVLVTDFFFDPKGNDTALDLISQLRPMGFTPANLEVILVSRRAEVTARAEQIAAAERDWRQDHPRGITTLFKDSEFADEEFLRALYMQLWERMDELVRPVVRVDDEPLDDAEPSRFASWFRTNNRELQQRVQTLLEKMAPQTLPILILGENGTGKEVLAKAIHRASGRKPPMMPVHIASFSAELVEGELFGHERGAFTGAVGSRTGKIREADGSTLFLDEIGEIPLEVQAKLLRVLQDKHVLPVGGSGKGVLVDFRLVSATNRDLKKMIETGQFREDLYYRINRGGEITLPPLSERREDIRLYAEFFWKHDTEVPARDDPWDEGAFLALLERDWAGNVRQLEGFIDRLKVYAPPGEVTRTTIETFGKSQPLYVPGLRDLKGFTARQYHVIYLPAAQQAIASARTIEEANRAIENSVYASHAIFFSDTPNDARKMISDGWGNHLKICPECKYRWKMRWGA
ncbi:MAG TPA: sigma 54-interacting transcriptional regulator [Thermoanaerobaculia bacterium]|nr:sigma 54-interacting transcriptional regulator [Thermoanaerobaculia bacterium]